MRCLTDMDIVLASRNKKKIAELQSLMGSIKDIDIKILSLDDIGFEGDIAENGVTFEENSVTKAAAVAKDTWYTIRVVVQKNDVKVYINGQLTLESSYVSHLSPGPMGLFAENADVLDGLEDDNPFRNSYKISLKDLSQATDTIAQIEGVSGVADVENEQAMMDNVLNFTNTIKHLSFWIMLILGFVSIFIIANTIKLAVYARRKEINVMKFVGATNWFIRWPFVFEGIIIGIIGALLAFALISWGYAGALAWISGFNLDMFTLKTYGDIWWILLVCFIGIGA